MSSQQFGLYLRVQTDYACMGNVPGKSLNHNNKTGIVFRRYLPYSLPLDSSPSLTLPFQFYLGHIKALTQDCDPSDHTWNRITMH